MERGVGERGIATQKMVLSTAIVIRGVMERSQGAHAIWYRLFGNGFEEGWGLGAGRGAGCLVVMKEIGEWWREGGENKDKANSFPPFTFPTLSLSPSPGIIKSVILQNNA